MKKTSPDFARFLLIKQNHRCYLRMTMECRTVDGWLHEKQLNKGSDERGWTWEHVIPRWLARQLNTPASLRLLACRACNLAKGNALPDDAHVVLADQWHREFDSNHFGPVNELLRRYQIYRRQRAAEDRTAVPETVEEALAQGGIAA